MAKVPRPGSLREACQILIQENTEDSDGTATVTYSVLAEVACSVENVSPFARLQNRGASETLSHKFTIRWRPDIDISHVIRYKDEHYSISTLQDVNNKRQFYMLYCDLVSNTDTFENPSPELSGSGFGDW